MNNEEIQQKYKEQYPAEILPKTSEFYEAEIARLEAEIANLSWSNAKLDADNQLLRHQLETLIAPARSYLLQYEALVTGNNAKEDEPSNA